jgi:outer membrane protein TolC
MRRRDLDTEFTTLERLQTEAPERLAEYLGREPSGQESADLISELSETWPTDDETRSVDVETAWICLDRAFESWRAAQSADPQRCAAV